MFLILKIPAFCLLNTTNIFLEINIISKVMTIIKAFKNTFDYLKIIVVKNHVLMLLMVDLL